MLLFDANDPYPLLPADSHSYAEAQLHSAEVDAWLGLKTAMIEAMLVRENATSMDSQQRWIGLPTQTLLTPYTEIRTLLQKLNPRPRETIVDLGAGYGRMGFVIGRHFPEVRFIGYELVEERVNEGVRCLAPFEFSNVQLRVADLKAAEFRPEPAEFYFLYDFGSRDSIEKTLQDLRLIARAHKITVVGRGRASRDCIERQHPWLSQIIRPEHHAHFSIYHSG
jgi:hypothetical protein